MSEESQVPDSSEVSAEAVTDETAALEEAAAKSTGIIPSTKFLKYDPANPPSAEMDCFGKYYLEGDIACHGDPSNPGSGSCILREECKIRTAGFQERIAKALRSSTDPSRVTKAEAKKKVGKYTSEMILEKVPKKAGIEVVVSDNELGVKYRQGTADIIFFSLWAGKNAGWWLYASKEFAGSKKDGDYWVITISDEGVAFDTLTTVLGMY